MKFNHTNLFTHRKKIRDIVTSDSGFVFKMGARLKINFTESVNNGVLEVFVS